MGLSAMCLRGGWGAAVAVLCVSLNGRVLAGQPDTPTPPPIALGPGILFPSSVVPTLAPSAPPAPQPTAPAGSTSEPVAAPSAGQTTATPSSSGSDSDATPLLNRWRHGLRFESENKNFSLFVGGRFQFDSVEYITTNRLRQNIPGTQPLQAGEAFRRLRLDMGGTIYKNIEFFVQVDFANGFQPVPGQPSNLSTATYPTDVWVTFKELPLVGNVRVGNQKPLYSFEHLTSSRFLNFMERSLGFDAFVEGFNNGFEPGITAFDTYMDKHGTWGIGLFKTTRFPFGNAIGPNNTEVNGRVTFLPVYEDDGKYLVHVGVGGADRTLDAGQNRFRSRLDIRNSPSAFSSLIADTGLFFGAQQQILVPELVAVAGPFSFQSEYYASWVQGAVTQTSTGQPFRPQGTVFFQSWYAEAHCFLTGEHREYNRETGAFTRVVPLKPVAWTRAGVTGWGAWQVAARYSYLDLNSKGIVGGVVNDMTLGLNWFLNPNMKLQGNYFLASRDVANPAGDGLIHGFGVRMAIDF